MSAPQKERTVLVIGASRGIGSSIATALARDGYDLILWARNLNDLEKVRDEVAQYNINVRTAGVDVSDGDAVSRQRYESLEGLSGLRGLVLCAGIGEWHSIKETMDETWRSIQDTNLGGAFYSIKAALPLLEAVSYSQVVFIGSDSSVFGMPNRAAYCSSKWGLRGLAECLRAEMRASRIKVTHVMVSRVDTYFRNHSPGDRPGALRPEQVAHVVAAIFAQDPAVEIREISMASMDAPYGG
jgi:NADP-dependent 3-hydroxy acid dehydrogenase YdfG